MTKPCPVCKTKCDAIASETGKYWYVRCSSCKAMSMVPVTKEPEVEGKR